MTEANIVIEEAGDQNAPMIVVHISGQLDESNVDEKVQEIYAAIENHPSGLKVILDLENLEYMNSKSIGYITDIYGKLSESGGQIVIVNARPNIVDILQVVGLTQLIPMVESLDQAKLQLAGATNQTAAPAAEPAPQAAPAQMQNTQQAVPAATQESTPSPAPAPAAETPTQPQAAPAAAPTAQPAPQAAPAPTPMPEPAQPQAPTPAPATTPEPATPQAPTAPAPTQNEGGEEGTYQFG